jgi:superfamily II DNA or RNA helicase
MGGTPQRFIAELETLEIYEPAPPSLRELGDHALQNMFLQAARIEALHGTAPFLALQRAAVVPVEYQLVPLVMALRLQPCRLLIADTTGLGKTVEAGLIMCELLARNQARSVLIITPANLRKQWKEQMRDFFHQDFHILSGETRKSLERQIPPGADPWLYFDRLIVSIDYAKDVRVRHEILKRKWDLVIVDEAHNSAMPHTGSGRKADMERYDAVREIAERCRHLLLLTATPHNGYTDSYCSLLEMLAPSLVEGDGGSRKPNLNVGRNHVCQRTRKDIKAWFESVGRQFPFPDREPQEKTEYGVDLNREYLTVLNELDNFLDTLQAQAAMRQREHVAEWFRLHLHRRALSSPEALRISIRNRIRKLDAPFESSDTDSTEKLSGLVVDKLAGDDEGEASVVLQADEALMDIGVRREEEKEEWKKLLDQLKRIGPGKDAKLQALCRRTLPELFQIAEEDPDIPARIIVFTSYKDTLNYYAQHFKDILGCPIFTLDGSLSESERTRRFDEFAESPKAVLIATDVISEGVNLQSASCMIVHESVPYNPNRLDQRNGRIDRYGQKCPMVYIRTLYCKDTSDEDVMELLVRKLERMRRDQGFSPPFFATEETILRVITNKRRKRAKRETLQYTFEDEWFNDDVFKRMVSEGFYGQADVKVTEVSEKLKELYAKVGTPEELRRHIIGGLRYFSCSVTEKSDGTLEISLTNPRLRVPGVEKDLTKVVLNPEDRKLHPTATLIDVGHPVVRRLNALIRQEGLRGEERARTAAFISSDVPRTTLLAHGILRAVSQTTPPVLLEELVVFGVEGGLEAGKLSQNEAEKRTGAKPAQGVVNPQEAIDRIRTFVGSQDFRTAQETAVADALNRIAAFRSRAKMELERNAESTWTQGYDQLELIGFEIYGYTLILPERK